MNYMINGKKCFNILPISFRAGSALPATKEIRMFLIHLKIISLLHIQWLLFTYIAMACNTYQLHLIATYWCQEPIFETQSSIINLLEFGDLSLLSLKHAKSLSLNILGKSISESSCEKLSKN